MGSGISGIYSGTIEKSQPFANTYLVCADLLALDKKDSSIYNPVEGYFRNPTAINLVDAIKNGGINLGNNRAHGTLQYVLDEYGDLIFGKRFNPNKVNGHAPHPTLIGGTNPRVQCAGMITFSKGKIVSIDNKSGHYKPNVRSLAKVDDYLNKLFKSHPEIFNSKSKWRRK